MAGKPERTVLGKITSVYGIKGWVKVVSYTDPMENILSFSQWVATRDGQELALKLENGKRHGKGLIAKLGGYDDREQAASLAGYRIEVDKSLLPALDDGEYYWHQLEGLEVLCADGRLLGKVSHLMETGSNDVLVVRPCKGSLDGRERLIPYVPDEYVKAVSLKDGTMSVDWDPEF